MMYISNGMVKINWPTLIESYPRKHTSIVKLTTVGNCKYQFLFFIFKGKQCRKRTATQRVRSKNKVNGRWKWEDWMWKIKRISPAQKYLFEKWHPTILDLISATIKQCLKWNQQSVHTSHLILSAGAFTSLPQ